jgi:Domain of unknown function (DUF4845)
MKKQRGIGFLGIFMICVIIVILAIFGMKIVPAYMEFFAIKDAINKTKAQAPATTRDVQLAFDRYANINNIKEVSVADLEITRDNGELELSFAYPKKIHMFDNVYVCIDFAASTAAGWTPPEPSSK